MILHGMAGMELASYDLMRRDLMFSALVIVPTLLLILLYSSAFAGECFLPPADPTDCSAVAAARLGAEFARSEIAESLAKTPPGHLDRGNFVCYLGAINYLSLCEKRSCGNFDISASVPLGSGWRKDIVLGPFGEPGKCRISEGLNSISEQIYSPLGRQVLSVIHTGDGNTIYKPGNGWPCTLANGRPTNRSLSVSSKGALFIDWTESGSVSPHWARRAEMPGRNISLSFSTVDPNTLRFEWSNGALFELGSNGSPKSSNFLDQEVFDSRRCATEVYKDKRHYYPDIKFKPGQRFSKLSGFVKS